MSRPASKRSCLCVLLLGVSLLTPLPSAGADMTPAEAFSQGRDFGAAQAGAIGGQVTTGTAQTQLPEYHNSAPAEALFQGGNGALFVPGQSRKDFCATPGGPLAGREKYDCDAVNLMSDVNNARAALQINRQTDPLLNNPNRTAVKANPEAYAGGSPTQTGSACVERQVTDPGQTRIEICNQAYGIENLTCQKILTVAVTLTNTCTPGTWMEVGTAWRNAVDQMHVQVLCDPTRSDGLLTFRVYAHGGEGACINWQTVTLPQAGIAAFSIIATLSPHWEGRCVNGFYAAIEPSAGCANGNCNYTFKFGAALWSCPQGGIALPTLGIDYSCIFTTPPPDGTCMPPSMLDENGQCQTNLGPAVLSDVIGWVVPSTFVLPATTHTETDTWDNQCAAYEARQ